MTFTYSLELADYLVYQLFTASQSPRIQRQLRRTHIGLSLASGVLAVLFYLQSNVAMAVYFGTVTGVVAVFYPRYFKWRHRRHYQKHIEEHYTDRVGEGIELTLENDKIETRTATAQSTIELSQVQQINDLPAHILVQLAGGQSLILPKRHIEDHAAFWAAWQRQGLEVVDHRNWKW